MPFGHFASKFCSPKKTDFFEFAHKAPSQKELKEILNSLLKETDEEQVRLLVKVARAIVK